METGAHGARMCKLEWGGMLADSHTGYDLSRAHPQRRAGPVAAPGPAVGEPVPGSRCPSVCPPTALTLMAVRTAPDGPKVQKVDLELPDRVKTSYTYEKVRLGRFGRAKVKKVAQGALLRFGALRTLDFLVHVCKNAKVAFCNFFIFRKFQKIFTF